MQSEKVVARALLLEGQRFLRDAIARSLAEERIEVVGAFDAGDDLIAALPRSPAELLVLGVAGAAGARRVLERATEVRPDLKVVIFTSGADARLIAASRKALACAVVDRFDAGLEDFLVAVREVAAGQGIPVARKEGRTPPPPLASLSQREREVLGHIGEGMDNLKIATVLGISEHTVKNHVGQLYRKLDPENRTALALLARDLGLAMA